MTKAEFIEKYGKPDKWINVINFESDLDTLLKEVARKAYSNGQIDYNMGNKFNDYWKQQ